LKYYNPLVIVKGAGDLATGVACCLFKSGLDLIMTEVEHPQVVRRKVAFAEAVYAGRANVEGIDACLAGSVEQALDLIDEGTIPVLVDPEAAVVKQLRPGVVVDARMAKHNPGTTFNEAPIVIGLGPGFTAGQDVNAVIETSRGPSMGRVIYNGSAIDDTSSPGAIDGYTRQRVLRAPVDGIMNPRRQIGDKVEKGEVVAFVETTPVPAEISGIIRGMFKEGIWVPQGTKIGDIDPRKDAKCDVISDKALAVGRGVLEAIFNLLAVPEIKIG